jgi:hypothetical protein
VPWKATRSGAFVTFNFINKSFISDDGVINVRQGNEVRLDIYGIGLTNDSEVKLTSSMASAGHACKSQGLHVQVNKLGRFDAAARGRFHF